MLSLENCRLCPRNCGINRHISRGFCGAGDKIKIAKASLHFWEEPCISGTRGSGTVFFSHCNLSCVYCQNRKISHEGFGKEISPHELAEIFLALEERGAHNINLVTPTPYVPFIVEALDEIRPKLKIPVVYNCGGYESPEVIRHLKDYIDIFLTDFKYYEAEPSLKYSSAKDYFDFAHKSLFEMVDICGLPKIKNGLMQRGVIVRHLVLPSHRQDSIKILKFLKENFGTDKFILSLMAQYFPPVNLADSPEINRKITSFEYNSVVNYAFDLGFDNAYIQDRSSAKDSFVPDFNLETDNF